MEFMELFSLRNHGDIAKLNMILFIGCNRHSEFSVYKSNIPATDEVHVYVHFWHIISDFEVIRRICVDGLT